MEEAGVLRAFTIENRRVEVGDPVEALPRVRIAGEYTQEGFEYWATPAVSTSALPRSPVWYPPTLLAVA